MKLGELITERRAALGGRRRLTYQELSDRARAAGHTLTPSTIAAFVNHALDESPKQRTIDALAVALDVDFNRVLEAVMNSMARDGDIVAKAADEPHVRAWVTLTEGRTPAERAAMIDVARSVAVALSGGQVHDAAEQHRPVDDPDPAQNDQSRNTATIRPQVTKIARRT